METLLAIVKFCDRVVVLFCLLQLDSSASTFIFGMDNQSCRSLANGLVDCLGCFFFFFLWFKVVFCFGLVS